MHALSHRRTGTVVPQLSNYWLTELLVIWTVVMTAQCTFYYSNRVRLCMYGFWLSEYTKAPMSSDNQGTTACTKVHTYTFLQNNWVYDFSWIYLQSSEEKCQ